MVWQEDLRALWSDLGWGVHIWKRGCVLEGHRSVLLYTPEAIKVQCVGGVVQVEGENLRILSLARDEVYIEGTVRAVWRE